MAEKELPDHFFRHNHAKMVAILVRLFGLKEIELAEDIAQDTLVEAMEKWSIQSIPDNPEGWLLDVAKKKTLNFLKRNQNFQTKVIPQFYRNQSIQEVLEFDSKTINDSTLQMIFVCCNPSLNAESQIALALKSLCGLSVSEIANALLTSEATINKRLYRAKQKFRNGNIQFSPTLKHDLENKLEHVLNTLQLLFNEGYYSQHTEKIIRIDLCYEAIRLSKELLKTFHKSSETKALMLFSVARIESRLDDKEALIILKEQDRSLWDMDLIALGMNYLNDSINSSKVNVYQLQAGISAEHCLATSFSTTNWKSISQQYKLLMKLDSNILIEFNQLIALFYLGEQEKALTSLLQLKDHPILKFNVLYHVTIGSFYSELNEYKKSKTFFTTAYELSNSTQEKALIMKRIELKQN